MPGSASAAERDCQPEIATESEQDGHPAPTEDETGVPSSNRFSLSALEYQRVALEYSLAASCPYLAERRYGFARFDADFGEHVRFRIDRNVTVLEIGTDS